MSTPGEHRHLIDLAHAKMPFGKYRDRYLIDLPEYYLVWYQRKGWPPGKLGLQMQSAAELKLNGLEPLLRDLRRRFPKDSV